jgi:hypothetical protein
MRWLLIALLVSVGGLLLAAAGVVRHIRLQRKRPKEGSAGGDAAVLSTREESDLESER